MEIDSGFPLSQNEDHCLQGVLRKSGVVITIVLYTASPSQQKYPKGINTQCPVGVRGLCFILRH